MKTAQDIIAILRERFSATSICIFTDTALEALADNGVRRYLGIKPEDDDAAFEAASILVRTLLIP